MARKAATREYLDRLVDWAQGEDKLATATGITRSNLRAYRQGTKQISWARLRKATEQLLGTPPAFQVIVEGYALKERGLPTIRDLPREPGLYALFDSAMRVIYYGKATSLYAEVRQTLSRHVAEVRPWSGQRNLTFRDITAYFSAYRIVRGDLSFIHDLEAFGLRILVNNTLNKNSGTFKRTA